MKKISKKYFNMFWALALISALPQSTLVYAQSSDVYINEIQVSTSSTDWEFFELQGTPGADLSDLTLVGIESDVGTSTGRIDMVISLAGQSIPADGFWLGISPAGTGAYGVSGDLAIANNSFENSTATYFLVSNFTAAVGDDLDSDDNGVLDSTPWDVVVDSINIRDSGAGDFSYGAPSVGPDGSFLPSGTYRCPDAPVGSFDGNIHNFSTPDGTPGRSNRSTCGIPEIYINEIQVSTSSTDWEFFELQGTPGADLSDLTLVGIESDIGSTTGRIDRVISLAGQSIPADGFWLGISPAGTIAYGVSGDLVIANNTFENGTATYFLVSNFTAAVGDDLDSDDNGVLDSTPWDVVVDSINIRDSGAGDFSYGAPSVGPDGSFLPSGTYRCPDAPAGSFDGNIHNFSTPDGTPGVTNACGGVGPPPPLVSIHAIQGSGPVTPLDGAVVAIEGIVVGDFQDSVGADGDLNGFFVQEEDADADADPLTSEGIFVFDGTSSPAVDVSVGDAVRVEGQVSESFGLTEITSSAVTVLNTGQSLPTAESLALPVASVDDFEAVEGMLVTFPQSLVISEYFNFDRFGEIVLTSERHLTPTAEFEPGAAAIQAAQDFLLDRITLDDGRTSSNPDPAIHPNGLEFDLTNLFRGGDTLQDVTGVMHFAFGQYRIQPTQGANYAANNPRTLQPDFVGDNLKVASFNVLNYFSTLDEGATRFTCGPSQDQGCRGADNATEFTRQRDKIIAALTDIDAGVVGLLEIENNIDDDAVQDLIDGLNAANGAGTYDSVSTGTIGTDAIKVALIYKPASVSLAGGHAILDSSVDSRFIDDKNRPVLAQTFIDNSTGRVFTVAVNHLKSKGSNCNDLGDPDTGDGSGNCNLTRQAAAEALVDWLAGDPTGSGSENFLIIGDLNSYDKEDPIDSILAGGYTDLLHAFRGEDAYSFVFDGQTGYLDYALSSESLTDAVTGATAWHISADEPDLIDYDTSFKKSAQDAIYAPDAYRSSDHDPIIIGLEGCEEDEITPNFEVVTVSPATLWPANHQYVDVSATVMVRDNLDLSPTITVSVTSSEADNGEDDGNTVEDIVIVDNFQFRLRAERSGTGSGRIYAITYLATDACGNSATATTTVSVPLSQGM